MVYTKFGRFDTMPINNCDDMNEKLQGRIKNEIELAVNGKSKRNIEQLNFILNELKTVKEGQRKNLIYPRMLIDSWDYNDDLTLELFEFADLYKN